MSKPAVLNSPRSSKSTTPRGAVAGVKDYEKLRVGREFLDVTWRMATPVVIFAGLGLLADRAWGSKPWMTLLGTLIGFLLAAILIKRQIGEMPADSSDASEHKETHDK